ncbi:MAG: bifunctional oligoribonuclease/PAP phosphatase NrnA [Bacteroidetes bacterium]|nr:bifunctional oligoribonuclease/PAP phosphatase NrnA [Bacteroidota bacterium]
MNLVKLNNDIAGKISSYLSDKGKSFCILTHVNPDGDAIGSALGLYGYLRSKGIDNVSVIVPNNYALFLHWMPFNDIVIVASEYQKLANDKISNADVVFCLDFNHPSRVDNISEVLTKSRAFKVLIDHHPQPESTFFDVVISNVDVSSTAELVAILIYSCENSFDIIDKDVASCLYAGIVTDTGSFSYSNRNTQTYLIVAELIDKGIDPVEIQRSIYDTFTEERMRLLGYCLSEKLTVLPNRKVAYISLTADELNRFNHKEGDTEGIVNYALSIGGIELAAFFMERDDVIKISFRSRRLIDVNKIARLHFYGGGHMNASGGKLKGSMQQAIALFEQLFSNQDINMYL